MKIGQGQEIFLAGLLIALGAGIACVSLLTLPGSIILPLLLLALNLSIFGCWRGSQWTWMAVLAAFFCVGMLRFMAADYLSEHDIGNFARETVKVEGILREEPRLTEDNQGQPKQRYLLDVTRVRIKGQEWQKARGGIYVYARHREAPAVRIGDKVTAAGKVRSPHGYQNPGQLDTKLLLKSQGITASLSAGKQGIKVEPVETAAFPGRRTTRLWSHESFNRCHSFGYCRTFRCLLHWRNQSRRTLRRGGRFHKAQYTKTICNYGKAAWCTPR
jgi:competence protein ComEC